MELNEDLPILIARAGNLFDRINQEIHFHASSFCRQCSENDGIRGTASERGEELVAIRDLLKEVQSMLVSLQRLKLRHQKSIESALARLDQSKIHLVGRMQKYPNHGRKTEVMEELENFLKNVQITPTWKLRDHSKEKNELPAKDQNTHFLITCIRSIMRPRSWFNATRMAVKVILMTAGVSSGFIICRTMIDDKKSTSLKVALTDDPIKLVVMHGRG